VLIIGLLGGCGSGGDETAVDPAAKATTIAGTATLLPSVKVIPSTKGAFISSERGNKWIMRGASGIRPGNVLLLEDATMKVMSVDKVDGMTELTVDPVEIKDVFSQLKLRKAFDQNEAEFIPAPESQIPAAFTTESTQSNTASPITGSVEKSLKIPYKKGPFTASLALKTSGKVSVDYDASTNAGITGTLDVTGLVEGTVSATTDGAISVIIPEAAIGILRIPIRISLIDTLAGILGIRIAMLNIPVSIGADADMKFAFGLELKGTAQSTVRTKYDAINGFLVAGPETTAGLTLLGKVPNSSPSVIASGILKVGPYVRARPQLVVLNTLASIGGDVKVGLYGQGQMKSIPSTPYYCLSLQAQAEGQIYGFFKGLLLQNLQSDPVVKIINVGPPWVYPDGGCSGVQFSTSSYSAKTTDNNATITVLRTGDTLTAATVHYAASDGTALAGINYSATSGDLSFNPNEATKSFDVPIINSLLNFGGTVNLALSQPSSGTLLGSPNTATLTITRTTVQFRDPTYTVLNTGGSALITVTRTGDASQAATVQYATSNGTAVAGQHYTATSGIITFGSMDTVKMFSVPILTTSASFTGTVNLTLSQASGAALGVQSTAVLTILPTDVSGPTVTIGGSCRFDGVFEGEDAYAVALGGSANGPAGFAFRVVNVTLANRATFMMPVGPLPGPAFIDCGSWTQIPDTQWPGCRSNGTQTNWALQASVTGDPAQHNTPIPFVTVDDFSSPSRSFSRVDICPPYLSGG
jgi:hypothetical protein